MNHYKRKVEDKICHACYKTGYNFKNSLYYKKYNIECCNSFEFCKEVLKKYNVELYEDYSIELINNESDILQSRHDEYYFYQKINGKTYYVGKCNIDNERRNILKIEMVKEFWYLKRNFLFPLSTYLYKIYNPQEI